MSAATTSEYLVDPPSGARLVGGDMMHWSDLKGLEPTSALHYLVANAARATQPSSVLLLGPRAASALDGVQTPNVSVLVRSLPDARHLAGLARERDQLAVYCGGIDRFATDLTFDLVVCLDDPTSLLTPDSVGSGTAELLSRVRSLLAPSGTAIVAVDNAVGLDEVFRLNLRTAYDDDSQWYRGSSEFDQRPPYRRELAQLTKASGLVIEEEYCAFPSSASPVLLVGSTLSDPSATAEDRRTLISLLTQAESAGSSHQPSLIDPYAAARKVVETGLVTQLAAQWILYVHADDRPSEAASPPHVILGDDLTSTDWATVLTLTRTADGWRRSASNALAREHLAERRVTRDIGALSSAHVPDGAAVEALLRAAAARGDVAEVRRVVQAYARWLIQDSKGSPERFFATPDHVVVDSAGAHHVLDPSWGWAEPIEGRLCLLRGLRVFARRLLRSGAEHPWRPDISPDALALTLGAMADLTWTVADTQAIAEREAELDAVVRGLDHAQEAQSYAANLDSGASQFTATPGPSRGYRENLALSGRMSQELHERAGQVEWLETTLRQRDRRVATLERELSSVRGSMSYKVGRRLTSPGRSALQFAARSGRKTALSMLPPDFAPRAERALRKLMDRR